MPANATLVAEEIVGLYSYSMPTAARSRAGMPILTGAREVRQQAWWIHAAGLSTFQLLQPLIKQLTEAGFEVLFTCVDDVCDGFDFRFATPVLPAPAMHVDLGDYRFFAMQRNVDNSVELLSLLGSRSSTAVFIQIIRVGPADSAPLATADAPVVRGVAPIISGSLRRSPENQGRFILTGLVFETGSAQLGDATFESLQHLSNYLLANPDQKVALVGHTDSVGSLNGNITLSKRRAGSVLKRLVTI